MYNLNEAFEEYLSSDEETFYLPPGNIELRESLFRGTLNRDINIVGREASHVKLTEVPLINVSSPIRTKIEYQASIERGQADLSINSKRIRVGDIVELSSPVLGELSWKYKKMEAHIVSKVTPGKVYLEDGFNFNYKANEGVILNIRKPIKVNVSNLSIETSNSKSRGKAMIVRGCKVKMSNLRSTGTNLIKKDDFMSCQACVDSSFDDIDLQDYRYGLLINNSRDILVKNIHADDTNHAVAPSTWSTNVTIDGYTGTNTVTDAHMGFDVTYKNVDVECGDAYFNCRSLGVTMENCKFRSTKKDPKTKIYIGVVALTDEQEYLRDEYDIVLKNVDWVHDVLGSNGLTISKCRNFVVEDCRTHLISTKGFCGSVNIRNSEIGSFKCYDSNFNIEGSTFDGALMPKGGPAGPIACSYSGEGTIYDTVFKDYRGKSLLAYIHGVKTSLKFEDCTFSSFADMAAKTGKSSSTYTGVQFKNCTFENKRFIEDRRFSSSSIGKLRQRED